jgi:threonine synthase
MDEELLNGVRELAEYQGIQACPEGAAAWKGIEKLARAGWLDARETIALFNTGTGLKYNHLFPVEGLPVLDHRDPHFLERLPHGPKPPPAGTTAAGYSG